MRPFLLSLLALLMLFSTGSSQSSPPNPGGPDPRKWKQIDALLKKNQTASAGKLVEEIYLAARQQQDAPEYLRAVLYKLRLLQAKEEEADEKAIGLLETDLKTARFPARPILHSLLGQLYARYYQQHRYQLYDRTRAAAPDSADASANDLRTWDAARLGSAVVRHYRASLQDEPKRQQQLRLAALGYSVAGGDVEGRQLRPTLYDLLAHRAIDDLQNEEFYITRPGAQFQLTAPALFGSAREFAALPLSAPAADSLNSRFHALQALQQLTQFRLLDAKNRPALAAVDLKRVDFLRQQGASTARLNYITTLERLAADYADLPIGTEFGARLAEEYKGNDPSKAVELAKDAESRFPNSRGAKMARRVREEIEQANVGFGADAVVLPNRAWRLEATARNVKTLHLWAYRLTLAEWQRYSDSQERQQVPFERRYARALAATPAATWSLPVPPPAAPYRPQQVVGAGPALPVGHYLLLLSNRADNPTKNQPGSATSYGVLAVSELSALTHFDERARLNNVLLLHRQSGALLTDAQVLPTYARYDPVTRKISHRAGPAQQPDAQGELHFPAPAPENADISAGREYLDWIRIVRGPDTMQLGGFGRYHSAYYEPREQAQTRTFLFTDRAIYRPGQTLYFKGILTESLRGKAHVLARQSGSVRLVDVNGQTVQTLPYTSSGFGSFHGSFVLPTSLLNGEMSLQTDHGSISFAVEDYKRPTFAVTFEPVAGTPELGKELVLRGRAVAYAGQPVDGARVNYRVVRRVLLPLFSYGGRGGYGKMGPGRPLGPGETEIAHGTAQTDAEGRFSIRFVAAPGEAADGYRWQPGHQFEATADVTDAAGETRTGVQAVVLGNQPVQLQLVLPTMLDRQKLPPVQLLSTGATGQPRPVAGTLRLFSLTPKPQPAGVPENIPANDDSQEFDQKLLRELPFDTEKNTRLPELSALLATLPTGRYELQARAATADSAQAAQRFTLYDSQAATIPYATPDWFVSLQDSVAPGQSATVLVGSRHAGARVLVEVEAGSRLLRKEWLTLAANEQRRVVVPADTAGLATPLFVHTTQVRDNRIYRHTATVQVAAPPAPLRLSIATFRDKLLPGQKETWRITIRQADGKPAAAELLATLYDQSLDAFRPHFFEALAFGGSYYPPRFGWQGEFGALVPRVLFLMKLSPYPAEIAWPQLNTWGAFGQYYGYGGGLEMADQSGLQGVRVTQAVQGKATGMSVHLRGARSKMAAPMIEMASATVQSNTDNAADAQGLEGKAPAAGPPDLSLVPARQDFRETAFWLPDLRTNAQGETVLEFQMPEAVTRWQLLALAHDLRLHSGLLRRDLVTQKQLQVTPNAPRFFREGDQLTFSAKLSNLTADPMQGTAQLLLFDARTQQPIDSRVLKSAAQLKFDLSANQSQALSWNLSIPETAEGQVPLEAITYRVVARGEFSGKEKKERSKQRRQNKATTDNQQLTTIEDGEENTLPVLPNRMLITESLPLPIVGPATREFALEKLVSTTSATRRNYSLTLEMTENPAWYAVQALPYLMEYPYQGSEQIFSRLYANMLSAKILQSNPRLKAVLAEWQRAAASGDKTALTSKLEQNQELKSLLLQETPWVRDAQSETERMRRLGELFDEARGRAEIARALQQLTLLQAPNGAFPWFDKMPDDRYITQVIVAGFGKLRRLGAFDALQDQKARPLLENALRYLDEQLQNDYAELRRQKGADLKKDHLVDLHIQALYARSFWPQQPVAKAAQPALAYYQQQAATFWPNRTRYLQAQLALALHRQKAAPAAVKDILTALSENALHSPELGMYWKDVRGGYYWREAPTETQATLIEAFDEINNDQKAVDEMKLWLLKQKQTQSWASTRATADACYALLLRGSDWLRPVQPIKVSVGGKAVVPTTQQAGTGYFKTTWVAAEIKAAQGRVTVQKTDAGVAWGALYWQYFEQIDKITPAATPVQLERQLYREQRTAGGPVLEPLTAAAPLKVGDVLVVRLVLRADRDLEYVHLKDQRAAGLELIGQTSGYRYQSGLGYYESPRDAATNFFIGFFPKGTHTFEYRLRATQGGNFSGGLSQIQCLYAPEFEAHSAGTRVQISALGEK
ncbi:MG2 domain-containing protein [Hymenobacter daecheongensis DSM 21074]|uniref:MG2 domain-containing protein n=1 Tax=Hymenobacter daecheongensis DSM 21074 TaxID=1121955 RepID=A0A1M6CSZ0_9BACT|nr:MG2 domain-containing protein [Hymenobacter daecheongensis]SHI63983.1 MG2 domain-containing protein [Hymenobacter daecheongensis DSM 21074]